MFDNQNERTVGLITDVPVFKSFMHDGKHYFYDTYSNRVFSISKEHYLELNKLNRIGIKNYYESNDDSVSKSDIICLIEKGLLKYGFIKKVIHPLSSFVQQLLENALSDMTLQVTQDCNFKCRYCLYANDTKLERNHKKNNMSWDIAKKAVDFLYDHSIMSRHITISFYGGEPLLNYDLIKKVVAYSKKRFITKRINYITTINGSLLTDDNIDFFIDNDFLLYISFDGPPEMQNAHRLYSNNGGNTFDRVKNNILRIKEKNIDYFNECVSIMPVCLPDEDPNYICDYIMRVLEIKREKIYLNQAFLGGVDYIESETKRRTDNRINDQNSIDKKLLDRSKIPEQWLHDGPCVPGLNRLFVNTEGLFLPCEKFLEYSNISIGSLDDGIVIDKVLELLNVGELTEKECVNCWAMRFCSICQVLCIDIEKGEISAEQKLKVCNEQKKTALSTIKDYIDHRILNEAGKIK